MSTNWSNMPTPPFIPPNEMPPGRGQYDASRKGHAHGVPRIPFTIDGGRSKPIQLVQQLRDRPLHTVATLNEDGEAEPPVQIFTEETSAMDVLRQGATEEQSKALGEAAPKAAAAAAGLGIYMDLTIWEHINLAGCAWEFYGTTPISVLTNFDNAWSCGFLFWGWRALGTNASSFLVSIGWPFFGFWDRAGNSIGWVLGGSAPSWSGLATDLGVWGWNDRAISIRLPGATFP
jgi:hypothetical protein